MASSLEEAGKHFQQEPTTTTRGVIRTHQLGGGITAFCLDGVFPPLLCILQEGTTMPTLLNNLFALPAATMIAQTTVSLRK